MQRVDYFPVAELRRTKMPSETLVPEQKFITSAEKTIKPQAEPRLRQVSPRVVRADRPEIQLEIQQAKLVPVMPESMDITDGEKMISEHQVLLERREPPVFTKPLRPSRVTEGKPIQ